MNQGEASAGASVTRDYLSIDAMRDASDTLLTITRSVSILAPNATSTGSKTLTVPATTPLGRYVVLGCADDLNSVGESDNTNNCAASADFVVGSPNARPKADAGVDQDVVVGSLIQLDGFGSTDADDDTLFQVRTVCASGVSA